MRWSDAWSDGISRASVIDPSRVLVHLETIAAEHIHLVPCSPSRDHHHHHHHHHHHRSRGSHDIMNDSYRGEGGERREKEREEEQEIPMSELAIGYLEHLLGFVGDGRGYEYDNDNDDNREEEDDDERGGGGGRERIIEAASDSMLHTRLGKLYIDAIIEERVRAGEARAREAANDNGDESGSDASSCPSLRHRLLHFLRYSRLYSAHQLLARLRRYPFLEERALLLSATR